jgi:hypothetical protein
VVAQGKVYLGLLDTERLSREFNALSPEFKEILLSLDKRLLKITNRAVSLYTKTDSITLPKKTNEIIKKSSSMREAFSITNGTAYVIDPTQKGGFPIITLEKESVFGNLPFLDIGHEPRSASVVASPELRIKPLDVESLQKEYDKLSNMFRSFIYNVCTCISHTTRLIHHLHSGNNKK